MLTFFKKIQTSFVVFEVGSGLSWQKIASGSATKSAVRQYFLDHSLTLNSVIVPKLAISLKVLKNICTVVVFFFFPWELSLSTGSLRLP